MREDLVRLREFHDAYDCASADAPTLCDAETHALRFSLMYEELSAYLAATDAGDLAGVADALADLLYVVYGTVDTHGLSDKMPAIFSEVHRSNMSKLGEDGRPVRRPDGKVLKGPNFSPPAISAILEARSPSEGEMQ